MSPPLLLPGGPLAAYALVCDLRSSLPSSVEKLCQSFFECHLTYLMT